jgi:D-alanyl-D-alanine carboxypeptidase
MLERYRGADGFKTGFVCASGYNFIGAATRSGRRIAAIVLGRDSQTSRAVDAARLITQGFEQPLQSGEPLIRLKPSGALPSGPRNMRSTLCTKQARAARYEPGAGQAVIDSPWLQKRTIDRSPLTVTLLKPTGRSKTPKSIPLPSFRPSNIKMAAPPVVTNSKLARSSASRVPLPTFRPNS